jgi:hypothetical protein
VKLVPNSDCLLTLTWVCRGSHRLQTVNAGGKVIGTLAEKGDFNALVAYTGQTGQKLDYLYLLQVGGLDVAREGEGRRKGGREQANVM